MHIYISHKISIEHPSVGLASLAQLFIIAVAMASTFWCHYPARAYVWYICMYVYIREYGSTLYVGLARAVSPTNTNFRLTFLLTRLQEALYEDLAV